MRETDRQSSSAGREGPMQGFPVPAERRVDARHVYATHASTRWFFQHVRQVVGTADLRPTSGGPPPHVLADAPRDLDGLRVGGEGGAEGPTLAAALEQTHTDAFLVLHEGAVVYECYFHGMRPETQHIWHSVSKSLVSLVAGNIAGRGALDIDQPVVTYVPELAGSAYGDARVAHLLDMQAGVSYSEDYRDEDAEVNELDRLYGLRPGRRDAHPGSSYDFAATIGRRGRHGVGFDYVSLNVNVLAWVLERATGRWLPELIRDEVWSKLAGEHDAYIALDGAGSAQAESGVCSSLRDLARLGLALAGGGELDGRRIVPVSWLAAIMGGGDEEAFAQHEEADIMPGGSYKRGFWVSRSPDHVAFMGLGIYGQMLYVNPEASLVVAKFSTQLVADDLDCFRLEFALAERLAEALS